MKFGTPVSGAIIALGVVATTVTTGCSNRQIYDAVRHSQMQECQKNPDSIREDCMENVSAPYDEYERQLNQVDEAAPGR